MRPYIFGRAAPKLVLGVLVLLVAMTATGYAAQKYLITSTKQISPKVLRALKGNAGRQGARGTDGPAGPPGAQGPQGPQGPQGKDGSAAASGIVQINGSSGNAEWQPGTNRGFPSPPIRKGSGKYCIPMPAGVDADTGTFMLTPTGTPSVEVAVTGADCANTTNWVEVVIYGPVNVPISPPAFLFSQAPQDLPFQVQVNR